MNDEEAKTHPRLLMLEEFGGEIEGELKFHKSLFQYREEAVEQSDWAFNREERGPTDPGFSEVLQSLEDLRLSENNDEEVPHRYHLTVKGHRVARNLKRGLNKLDDRFEERMESLSGVAEQNKDRSGSEIVADDEIQAAKEETYQSDV